MEASVEQPAALESSLTLFGVLILVISALSFTRAMQRLYVRAWRLPKLGMLGNGWGLLWLASFCAYFSLQPVILSVFSGVFAFDRFDQPLHRAVAPHSLDPRGPADLVAAAAAPGRADVAQPGGVRRGLRDLHARGGGSASRQFGVIGVAFSLLSWLFVATLILVVTAAFGATLAESPRASRERTS